jgi:hypothetical protein
VGESVWEDFSSSSDSDDEESPSSADGSTGLGVSFDSAGEEEFANDRVFTRPERKEFGRPKESWERSSAWMRGDDEEEREEEVNMPLMLKWLALDASCFLGALPPCDFRCVAFTRAIRERGERGKKEAEGRQGEGGGRETEGGEKETGAASARDKKEG